MNSNRIRWGAVAWLLTLQFFVVETIAQLRFEGTYSRADDVISALGAADSAAHQLMNASFVVQAALILGGALLLRPVLPRGAGLVARILLGVAALGVVLVGVFPTDGNSTMHTVGAVLHLVGGGLGLIALAYAVRPRSEALGTTLALLGLVGTAATVFFLTGVTGYLGDGGTERAAAYPIPIGLALAGLGLWRLGRLPGGTDAPERPSRRERRDQARAERVARDHARDQALTATLGTVQPDEAPREPGTGHVDEPGTGHVDDVEDDPWTSSRRRRD
ncbi:MAG TPA: DUF998 domain-containing protein [Blastococcus sp.]